MNWKKMGVKKLGERMKWGEAVIHSPRLSEVWTLSVITATEPSDTEYRWLKKNGDSDVPLSP
jgi:hypothetical protein